MKRSLGALGLFFSAAAVSGCPVYSNNVLPVECIYATDCPVGYRCASGGVCVPGPPHVGGTPRDGGDADAATDAGAVDGEAGAEGGASDVSRSDAARDAAIDAPPSDGGGVVFCATPNDCAAVETCGADGSCHAGNCLSTACINGFQCQITASGPACVRGDVKSCGADRHCLGDERCLDGKCWPVSELCTDRAQCGAGKACADGRCITSCTADGQCAPGFLCRSAAGLGFCGAKAKPCALTRDCASATEVCVDGACVPRCGAAGACGTGVGAGLCVDSGCVPATKPLSECATQGTQGTCPAGTICLHHHCYASCAADSGGCTDANAPECRAVTVAGASYDVCGTMSTLGSECDLTASKPCMDGKTCVDGFCR